MSPHGPSCMDRPGVASQNYLETLVLRFCIRPIFDVFELLALSILFVAAEIAHSRQGRIGLTERFPWIAFIFGLLHGFGFGSALSEVQSRLSPVRRGGASVLDPTTDTAGH